MTITAQIARPLGPFASAPLALLAYAGALWLTGGIDKGQLTAIRELRGGVS